MPRSVTRVVRRGDTFYLRMAVPDRLVGRVGQREVKVSLRTSSPMDARLRGRALSNAIDILFESLPHMPQLTTAQIRDRIRAYFQESLNKSLELSYDLPVDPQIDVSFEINSLKDTVEELRGKLAARSFSATVISDAKALLASLDVPPSPANADALSEAAIGVMRAKIERARILAAMLSADYAATAPIDPMFAGMEPTGLPRRRSTASAFRSCPRQRAERNEPRNGPRRKQASVGPKTDCSRTTGALLFARLVICSPAHCRRRHRSARCPAPVADPDLPHNICLH